MAYLNPPPKGEGDRAAQLRGGGVWVREEDCAMNDQRRHPSTMLRMVPLPSKGRNFP